MLSNVCVEPELRGYSGSVDDGMAEDGRCAGCGIIY